MAIGDLGQMGHKHTFEYIRPVNNQWATWNEFYVCGFPADINEQALNRVETVPDEQFHRGHTTHI